MAILWLEPLGLLLCIFFSLLTSRPQVSEADASDKLVVAEKVRKAREMKKQKAREVQRQIEIEEEEFRKRSNIL